MNIKKESFLKEFGAFIKQLREQKKLTKTAVADRMGAGKEIHELSRIEDGKINFGIYTIIELAEALDEHPSALLKFYNKSSSSTPSPNQDKRKSSGNK